MDHIYELKQSNYTFDFRMTNPEPLSSEVLPETKELDMSYIKEEINIIKSNRVIVWANGKSYTILGSVGGLLLILILIIIIVGSCIIVIKYKLRSNIQSECIKMKYSKGNSEKKIFIQIGLLHVWTLTDPMRKNRHYWEVPEINTCNLLFIVYQA